MTVTIRSLVLLSACILGAGCSDAEPATAKPKVISKAQPSLAAASPSKLPTAAEPALTGAAPMAPRSILDAPSAGKHEPTASAKSAESAELSNSARPEDASGTTAIDFERALSPEEVNIDRFVLATGVKEREPVGESNVFPTDTKIFAFVQLANEGAPYAFRVHWEPVDGPASPYGVQLNVRTAKRFRTWSWTAIPREPGRYKAVLRTLDGQEIASREFEIEPAIKAAPSL